MKAKKFTALVLSALVVLMAVPIAFAEDTADEQEVTAMDNQHGAKMRLEQLEKKIEFNLEKGNKVIGEITETHPEVDVTELQSILDEGELVLEDLRSISWEDMTKEEMVDEFLSYKSDMRSLTKEFKDTLKELLPKEALREIKKKFKEDKQSNEISPEVQAEQNNYQADLAEETLTTLGQEDPEFIDSIRNGELTQEEIKQNLRDRFNALSPEEQADLRDKIKEKRHDLKEFRKESADREKERKYDKMTDKADKERDRKWNYFLNREDDKRDKKHDASLRREDNKRDEKKQDQDTEVPVLIAPATSE